MIEIKQILCPIDFSDHSRHAFDHAAAIARWYESTITLLYVHPVVPLAAVAPGAPAFPPLVVTQADMDQVRESMERFVEEETGSRVSVRYQISEGSAAPEILYQADGLPADLIVLGTHGRSGFERLVLGSVAEKVLRRAGCPVLTVPPRAPDAVPAALFRNILCATDFSDSATLALNYAMSIAQEADARLTVVHVAEIPSDGEGELFSGSDALRQYAVVTQAQRTALLQAAVPDAVRAYCTVDTVLAKGRPYREILRIAEERKTDLIVIGVHGRDVVDRMLFGSTTQHVVRQATCPVLTLRTR
jgi:nucleotide-binding universal stress UspA family protein